MTTQEPPRPRRGALVEDHGSAAGAPAQDADVPTTFPRLLIAAADPRLVLAQADGYPPGVKQFLQLCLILVYPAWLFLVLLAWPVYALTRVLWSIWWVLATPLRRWMMKNRPEDYEASRRR